MAECAIILLFDTESFANDAAPPHDDPSLTPKVLHDIGQRMNEEIGSGWLGYSGWMAVHNIPQEKIAELWEISTKELET